MSLLAPNYYTDLLQEEEEKTRKEFPISTQIKPVQTPVQQGTTEEKFPDISPEKQIKRFGGEVGSPEYFKTKANKSTISRLPGEMGSALGIELPPDEEWDKMSRNEQAMTVTGATLKAAVHFVFALPKVIASIPFGIGSTVNQGWRKITKGAPLVEEKPIDIPLIGEVPSYFKTYQEARDKGMGPLSSAVVTSGRAIGDALILYQMGGALKNSLAPKAKTLKEGEVLYDTKPVEEVLVKEQNKMAMKKGEGNPSEYYPLTKTDAKQIGGIMSNSGNTFFKFTPVTADGAQVELSVVRLNNVVTDFFSKITKNKPTQGKFGNETKLYSEIIETKKQVTTEKFKEPKTLQEADKISTESLARFGNDAVEETIKIGGKETTYYRAPDSLFFKKTETVEPTIPSKPLKGFETKLVNEEQIANVDAITKINAIDTGIQTGVVKALTGKDAIGNLTQAEYVNVAQTLSKLNKISQYVPEAIGFGNWLKNYLSPTRYWTRDVQQATGIPVHDVHMRIETGHRIAKVSERAQLGELYSNPIIEKYSASKYAGERALVKEYMEGNTSAILDNPTLNTITKNELIESAGILDVYLKKIAEDVGMESKVFLENYAPHVQERGGVFQLYKESGNVPSGSEAFFTKKRTGGLYTQIQDAWALADIYTRAAYKAKYLGPALDEANLVNKSLPSGIKERFASYVQEKLGYGGKLEQIMDKTALSLNKKLGLNLPPDTARVFTNQTLNTMYSSAMSQPATWLRNAFQYPTLGYAYWGSKFMGSAMTKAYSKAGMEEFLKSGFSVDLGVPFGEELVNTSITSRMGSAYRNVTQGVLKPQAWIENKNRAPMYFQTKMIFDDTIAKFNEGKLTWTQVEKELGLNKLSQSDANLIRQDLINGKLTEARGKLIQEAIDDTQFPYRRGESWRLGYGMSGKILTPFMQWPVEYIHTLSKWAGTGQWDKLARWYASSSIIARTFQQEYNTDFSKSLTFGPLQTLNYSPPPATAILNGLGLIYNQISDNEQAYEKNADELFKILKLAIPGGVEGVNIIKAYKAYQNGPIGPNGTYAFPDSAGRPNFYSFKDLFWNALGMPTLQKTENQNLQKEMSQDKFQYTQNKKDVLNLYQDGMSLIANGKEDAGSRILDKANKIIDEWATKGIDLSPTDDDFNKFYIPATEQTWNYLPASLKAKYAPRIFK